MRTIISLRSYRGLAPFLAGLKAGLLEKYVSRRSESLFRLYLSDNCPSWGEKRNHEIFKITLLSYFSHFLSTDTTSNHLSQLSKKRTHQSFKITLLCYFSYFRSADTEYNRVVAESGQSIVSCSCGLQHKGCELAGLRRFQSPILVGMHSHILSFPGLVMRQEGPMYNIEQNTTHHLWELLELHASGLVHLEQHTADHTTQLMRTS